MDNEIRRRYTIRIRLVKRTTTIMYWQSNLERWDSALTGFSGSALHFQMIPKNTKSSTTLRNNSNGPAARQILQLPQRKDFFGGSDKDNNGLDTERSPRTRAKLARTCAHPDRTHTALD